MGQTGNICVIPGQTNGPGPGVAFNPIARTSRRYSPDGRSECSNLKPVHKERRTRFEDLSSSSPFFLPARRYSDARLNDRPAIGAGRGGWKRARAETDGSAGTVGPKWDRKQCQGRESRPVESKRRGTEGNEASVSYEDVGIVYEPVKFPIIHPRTGAAAPRVLPWTNFRVSIPESVCPCAWGTREQWYLPKTVYLDGAVSGSRSSPMLRPVPSALPERPEKPAERRYGKCGVYIPGKSLARRQYVGEIDSASALFQRCRYANFSGELANQKD